MSEAEEGEKLRGEAHEFSETRMRLDGRCVFVVAVNEALLVGVRGRTLERRTAKDGGERKVGTLGINRGGSTYQGDLC